MDKIMKNIQVMPHKIFRTGMNVSNQKNSDEINCGINYNLCASELIENVDNNNYNE